MITLRHSLHRNNYPERITSAPRNLDRRMEDNTRKLTAVCLPYIKGLAERIQKICSPYDVRTEFTSGSFLRRYLFRVKPPTEFNMIKNCVYSIYFLHLASESVVNNFLSVIFSIFIQCTLSYFNLPLRNTPCSAIFSYCCITPPPWRTNI